MTITHTEVALGTLSRDDVRALQQADGVVFRVYQGKGTIEASLDLRRYGGESEWRILSVTQQRLFGGLDGVTDTRKRIIEVPWTIRGWETSDSGWHGDEQSSAFEYIQSAQYTRSWGTIASLLRDGDRLRLDFHGGKVSPLMDSYPLYLDELSLLVDRGIGKTRRTLEFNVEARVGLDNTARMIKRYGPYGPSA